MKYVFNGLVVNQHNNILLILKIWDIFWLITWKGLEITVLYVNVLVDYTMAIYYFVQFEQPPKINLHAILS